MSFLDTTFTQPRYSPTRNGALPGGCRSSVAFNRTKPGTTAELEPSARDAMLAAIPRLRAFAISLCGNADRADDLVQETLFRAWTHMDAYRPGSMIAWLVTILRNVFRGEFRKRRREVADSDGRYAEMLTSRPAQVDRLELDELFRALAELPVDNREALILVGASGFTYQETADICGCAVGTIKSRVNRGRNLLAGLIGDPQRDMNVIEAAPTHRSAFAVSG
jgi:RNA polymerase sigma-70 factor, ECF subfamily